MLKRNMGAGVVKYEIFIIEFSFPLRTHIDIQVWSVPVTTGSISIKQGSDFYWKRVIFFVGTCWLNIPDMCSYDWLFIFSSTLDVLMLKFTCD